MTANEMQSYLNQVVEVESKLMGLRASYEALKMRDQYYTAVGTKAEYSVGSFGYGRNLRNEHELRRTMSDMDDWLNFRGKWRLEDDKEEYDEEEYDEEEYDEEEYVEEENEDEVKPIASFSNYAAFAQRKPNQIIGSITNEDNNVRRDLFARNFQAPEVVRDSMPALEKVEEPKRVDKPAQFGKAKKIGLYLSGLYFGALAGFILFLTNKGFTGVLLLLLCLLCAYLLVKFALIVPLEKKQMEYEAYLEKKKAYDEYISKKEALRNIDPFAGTKERFQTAFNHAAEIASGLYEKFALRRNQLIRDEIQKLEKQIQESEGVLNRLYALNVLHPKYRNLTAVSTILEYIETGRCSELTGHEGAYNLYESELRQNLIIAKLDVVIQKLDELKATMYRCCMAVENVGKQIQGLEKELKTLNSTAAKQLAVQTETLKFTALNATYSAAIQANTEAIKYLTLVN